MKGNININKNELTIYEKYNQDINDINDTMINFMKNRQNFKLNDSMAIGTNNNFVYHEKKKDDSKKKAMVKTTSVNSTVDVTTISFKEYFKEKEMTDGKTKKTEVKMEKIDDLEEFSEYFMK